MTTRLSPGSPDRLGAHFDGEGTDFAVFSDNADAVDLCLFSQDGTEEVARLPMPERSGAIWHGHAPGVTPGTPYGYRVHGVYAPEHGHRFNPNKLLLDPYARELTGAWVDHTAVRGYEAKSRKGDLSFDKRDSAPFVAKGVVSDPDLFTPFPARSSSDWRDALIYEAHPKGLTQQHPNVPDDVRGTYEGLASDAILSHLGDLGITAIELLPVHAFIDEGFLAEKGLRNYWGYNTIGFFAPEPRYFGPAGVAGFREMVRRFHSAGIEVILDVVYNHTAEGNQNGPTLSFRGLDNASYYRLVAGQPRYYVNDTGCGNTVDATNPYVLRMILDSLRFWVECMGVDGFRFDLATTLAREEYGFDPIGGFFDAIRQDPVLSRVKLIAEPWDIGPGGYQLGHFPHPFGEWNDRYRDSSRRFWRGDIDGAQELAARLMGSADTFERGGRRSWSSVNLLTSHDGFTLADVTAYNERHNQANGEGGVDGHGANFSDNCGVEGRTDDAAINARRDRRRRNMLATLFLSQGTPMLLAGDEIANSQQGNNNAYCQDNAIGWIDWAGADTALSAFVAALSRYRSARAALRQTFFLHGEAREDDTHDVEWRAFDGSMLQWRDPGLAKLCLLLRSSADTLSVGGADDTVYLVFNRSAEPGKVTLPKEISGGHWVLGLDTASEGGFPERVIAEGTVPVAAESVMAFHLVGGA